jgi:predicted dehydrogenase
MININTDIKIAVAGCGSAGRNNIREFLKIDDVEITACCDTEEVIARHTSNEFGIPEYYTNIVDMLDNEAIDALIVSVPDGEHLLVSIEALKRGVNVFCENPLASNYGEAVEMTRIARESGLTAVVNNNLMSMPVVNSALRYIENGLLGRVKYMEASFMQNRLDSRILDDPYEEKRLLWRLSSAAGSAGALGELGFLLYDIAVRICGDLSGVSTMIKNIAGFDEIEEYQELDLSAGDTFVSQIEFTGGAAGVLRGSWTAGGPHEQITLTVYGEEASLMLDTNLSENDFTVYSVDGPQKIPAEKIPESGLHESFISALKGESLAVSDFDKGLKIQYYLEQSRLSNDGGLRLDLEHV